MGHLFSLGSDDNFFHAAILLLLGCVAHLAERWFARYLGLDLLRRRTKKDVKRKHRAHSRKAVDSMETSGDLGTDGEGE